MFENHDRRWRCLGCSFTFVAPSNISPASCSSCGCEGVRHIGYVPAHQVMEKNKEVDFVHDPTDSRSTIPSLGRHAGRTPEQQEKLYGKIIDNYSRLARAKKRDARKRGDDDCRWVGSMPREMAVARQNQFGKNYLTDNSPKDVLKREGLYRGD